MTRNLMIAAVMMGAMIAAPELFAAEKVALKAQVRLDEPYVAFASLCDFTAGSRTQETLKTIFVGVLNADGEQKEFTKEQLQKTLVSQNLQDEVILTGAEKTVVTRGAAIVVAAATNQENIAQAAPVVARTEDSLEKAKSLVAQFYVDRYKLAKENVEVVILDQPNLRERAVVEVVSIAAMPDLDKAGKVRVDFNIKDAKNLTITLPLGCEVRLYRSVPTATRHIDAGQVIQEADVTTNRVTFDPRVKNVTQDIRLFVGSQATRALEQGAELNASMVRRLPLVNKGSVVTLFARVNDGPYSVQMTGTALNDATNGDIVDVEVKSQDPKSQALKILKTGVAVGTNLVEMK